MKILRPYIAICIVLFTIFSCSSRNINSPIIKIKIYDNQRTNLKIDIKDIIPLETSPNSLLADVSKARYFNHRFYLYDDFSFKTISVFDESGVFLRKTCTGKGPGELISPGGFAINKEDSVIIVFDTPQQSSLVFDLELHYLSSQKCDDFVIPLDFYHISSDTYLIYHHYPTTSKSNEQVCNYSLFSYNLGRHEPLNIPLTNNKSIIGTSCPVSITEAEVLFVTPWNHNIYELKNGQANIWCKLDFGDFDLPDEILSTISDDEIWSMMRKGEKVGNIHGLVKSDNFIAFMFPFKRKVQIFFHSLTSNVTYCINDSFDSNEIPVLDLYGVKSDGTFFGLLEADELMRFQKESGNFSDISAKESDNPYIILFSVYET